MNYSFSLSDNSETGNFKTNVKCGKACDSDDSESDRYFKT